MNKGKFYITTAIAYTSRKPHIGNSYEIVLTDAIARFKRLQGYDVFFLTGTDEHGQKIEQYAAEAGVSPKEYVDKVAGEIRGICDTLNTTYDKFIRTTDDYHEKAVQKIFKKLYDQGDIYKSKYEGYYCVACESFYTKTQLEGGKCPDCGGDVKIASEEAYFLRLSKYQKQLEKYIEDNPDFIYPESRKNEMLNNFIRPGLQDLCVSRSSFKWGVPVSFDDRHVIYVWIDALSNYITALGYDPDGSSELYQKYWPADVHIIGKDIIRFHTIYWPIILMALGEPLPKQVYGHPWLLFGEDKMSKSKGNVIYADDLAALFGVDAVRYYLLSEMPHASDGSISYTTMIERFNSDLANTIGNLVNRTVSMVNKYFDGVLVGNDTAAEPDEEFKNTILTAIPAAEKFVDEFRMSDAVEAVVSIAKRCNKYIDETMPWALAKNEEDRPRLATVMYNLIEGIRILAVMLSPFMPETSEKIFEQIGVSIKDYDSVKSFGATPVGTKVGTPVPLFARIDGEKLIEELIAKQKAEQEKEKALLSDIKASQEEKLPEIEYDDFAKISLIAAKITDCEPVKRAKKLLKLTLDDGSGEPRTVASGIAEYYTPDELKGRTVVVVANLKPRALCGVESRGMILAGDGAEGVKVLFVDGMEPGTKIR